MLYYYEQAQDDLIAMGGILRGRVINLGNTRWISTGYYAGDTRELDNLIYVREDCADKVIIADNA